MPFGLQPGVEPETFHQSDSDLFEYAGPDPAEHITGRLSFDHEAVDALGTQQVPQEQSGGACTANAGRHFHTWTTFCSIAPNGSPPSSPRAAIRTVSPNAMKGVVAGPLSRIISMARTSEMQLEPT